MRSADAPPVEVVQLLGDIDDIVSRADNEDLRTTASRRFAMLMVRGSGHGDIIDFGAAAKTDEARQLGAYRRAKFLTATTAPFAEVQRFNEQLPPATDERVEEAVFVLHGIRDLGRWSADFEAAIQARFPERRGRLAVVSPRYGYFGMGPFLFEDVRDRYVRWFMDEYTEALARWPNLQPEGIRFFGHSNGTYVVAKALETYPSMRIERVVFAGSVVPRRYDWAALGDRVGRVRNYVGTADWVVALFPRLFELWPLRLLGNDLGSAGFNGFVDESRVDNVRFVAGQHSAFASRVDEIVDFLLAPGEPKPALREARGTAARLMDFAPLVFAVWAALAAAVLALGARIVGASPVPGWPVLLAYGLLVLAVLRTV
jgi:pimeloyl-ACP methyl ester carboxylesterase